MKNHFKYLLIVLIPFVVGCGGGGSKDSSSMPSQITENGENSNGANPPVPNTPEQNTSQPQTNTTDNNTTINEIINTPTPLKITITDNVLGKVGVYLVDRKWVKDKVTFTFEFSQKVIDFDMDDIKIANGTKSNFRKIGDQYLVDVTPLTHSKSSIVLTIDENQIHTHEGYSNTKAIATQEVDTQKAFITTWDTTNKQGKTDSNQILISTNPDYVYNYTIDWGDGTIEDNITGDRLHTYESEGNYTIEISGQFPAIYNDKTGSMKADENYDKLLTDTIKSNIDSPKLLLVNQWGTQQWQSMELAFALCTNVNFKTDDNPDMQYVTSMDAMFLMAKSFDSNISTWDVSGVTSMSATFGLAISFNQDIGDWNVSNVVHMDHMFINATNFNQKLSDWNLSNVKYMTQMFYGAYLFNQDIGRWDVSKVVDMSGMFFNVFFFNHDISQWDVSNVEDMSHMFDRAMFFNQNINKWNVSKVKNMEYMFAYSDLNHSLSDWDVSNVTSMKAMFVNTQFLQDLSRWDVSSVTDMSYMFANSKFNGDLSQWDVSNVTNMYGMFYNTNYFNSDLSQWDISDVTNMSRMFELATAFQSDLSQWNVSNVTNMSFMFNKATSFDSNLTQWNTASVTNMQYMFAEATAFSGDISQWNVLNATNMKYMFFHAISFDSDISRWNVSKVKDMNSMFFNAETFDQDLTRWDVSSVQNMSFMFGSAFSFRGDLSNWDVSNVQDMSYMFTQAGQFNGNISRWDVSKVRNMSKMFEDTNISSSNYNDILINWSKLPLQNSVILDMGHAQNSASYSRFKTHIIDAYNWTIQDGGTIENSSGLVASSPDELNGTGFVDEVVVDMIPQAVDLSADMPPVRDQGAQNSCVAWSVGYYLKSYQEHIERNQTYGAESDYRGVYSPSYLYNRIKKSDSCESGASIASAMKMLVDEGVSGWRDMPYDANGCSALPSSQALEKAHCATINSFQQFKVSNPMSANEIYHLKYYLAQNYPIVAGIRLYHDFYYPQMVANEYQYTQHNPSETSQGQHSVVVVGYDDSKNAFKIVNSWGEGWGNGGYLWIDYDVFKYIAFEAFKAEDSQSDCPLEDNITLPPIGNTIAVDLGSNKQMEVGHHAIIQPTSIHSDHNIIGYAWFLNGLSYGLGEANITFNPINVGEYNLTLRIEDDAGNTAIDWVTIRVVDTTPPTITLNGESKVTLLRGANYQELGVKIIDIYDKDINATIKGNVDTNTIGLYQLIYTAKDKSGNQSSVSRLVSVVENNDLNNSLELLVVDNFDDEVSAKLTQRKWVADKVTFTFYFSQNVKGFESSDIEVLNGTKSNFRGYGDTYQIDVVPPLDLLGEIVVSVDSNKTHTQSEIGNKYTQVKQKVNTQKSFITIWDTTKEGESESNQIIIRINRAYQYNYSVDWGDGMIDEGNTFDTIHAYGSPGIYEVKITGLFPAIFNDFTYIDSEQKFVPRSDNRKLLSVEQWGTQKWRDMKSAFAFCEELNINADDDPDLSSVSNNSFMFFKTKLDNSNLSHWGVSHVTDMSAMFAYSSFNGDLSRWDVSNVVYMDAMFFEARLFDSDLSSWNVSNVTSMTGMFSDTNFQHDLSQWDVSNVTNMSSLFANSKFSGDLSGWNVSKVTDMSKMFRNATLFSGDLNNWDVSSVTNMSHMFYGAKDFQGTLDNWNTANVTNMSYMFLGAERFNGDLSRWDTSKVTDMSGMFALATLFNSDLSTWDVSNVTSMYAMFLNTPLFSSDLSHWNVSSVTDMYVMFYNAQSFDSDLSGWDVSHVTDMSYMLSDTSFSTQNYNLLLEGWSQLDLQPNVSLSVDGVKYSSEYASERQYIIDTFYWDIYDGGVE